MRAHSRHSGYTTDLDKKLDLLHHLWDLCSLELSYCIPIILLRGEQLPGFSYMALRKLWRYSGS